jgi:hypothetical protein
MQGFGSLGAPESIAALRHLRRLVLDNVVLHAQVGTVYEQQACSFCSLLSLCMHPASHNY